MAGLLLNDQGDRLEWLVTAHDRHFVGYYRVLEAGKKIEVDAFSRKQDSRDQALDWLRREARARGFDASGIK